MRVLKEMESEKADLVREVQPLASFLSPLLLAALSAQSELEEEVAQTYNSQPKPNLYLYRSHYRFENASEFGHPNWTKMIYLPGHPPPASPSKNSLAIAVLE